MKSQIGMSSVSTLEKYRSDKNAWQELAYAEAPLPDDETEDVNARPRLAVLFGLQYDRRDTDKELVRYLFEQVLSSRASEAEDCITEMFRLSAYLLARFRDPADIPLFYRAKRIDFDAWAGGFDEEFMYWALKDETHGYLAEHFPELYDDYKDVKRDRTFYDGLEQWWTTQSKFHPACLAEEDLLTLFERSIYFGEIDDARDYLQTWIKSQPISKELSTTLRYAYEKLGDDSKVIEILQEKLKKIESRGWDRASVLHDLLKFHSRARLYAGGFECIQLIDIEFSLFDDWKRTGLGWGTIAEAFGFVLACDENDIATRSFLLVHSWAEKMNALPWGGLEAGERAAVRCGLLTQANDYRELARKERERIELEHRFPPN